MALWNSNTEKTLDYLESERIKLWQQLRSFENETSHLKAEARSIKEDVRSLKDESSILKEAVEKKTSDYESEAKGAAKKAVEYKNKSAAAKETITQFLDKSNDHLEAIKTINESVGVLNNQLNEIVDNSKAKQDAIVEVYNNIQQHKTNIEDHIKVLETLFANHSTYANNIQLLESLTANGQESSTKIETLTKSILSRKKEIDEIYYQILGYTQKNQETNEEQKVPGLKDELEGIYDELKVNLSQTNAELLEHKRNQLSDYAEFVQQKENDFNSTINNWEKEYINLDKKIKDLLPKAMTAGLSYAYSEKKDAETIESNRLSKQFVWSIVGLVAVSLIPFGISIVSWINNKPFDKVLLDLPRLVISILPLYIPVLWIAYSANKNMKLSKRLIEEYTHKEVLSKTFEGLSNQISAIGDNDISFDLRTKLLYNILEVNSENPGKLITDYNKSDHPLMDALEKSVKLSEAVDKLSQIPGFSKLTNILSEKTKKLLKEKESQAVAGLDMVTSKQKDEDKSA